MDDVSVDNVRYCATCGKRLERKARESHPQLARRQTCGNTCKMRLPVYDNLVRQFPPKTCEVCGITFRRTLDTMPEDWLKRRTCSHGCANKLSAQTRSRRNPNSRWAKAAEATPPKTCGNCGKEFRREIDETPTHFNRRSGCAPACRKAIRQSARKIAFPAKWCTICGVRFERRQDEPPHSYRARVTCDQQCAAKWRVQVRNFGAVGRLSPYPSTWNKDLRAAIRARDGNVCVLCGATPGSRDFPVHHISGDKSDCRPQNLVTLCPSCHGRAHHKSTRDGILSALVALSIQRYSE